MLLFWFVSFANGIKRIRDKTFFFMYGSGPTMHTTHITYTRGGVQLWRVAWDLYVWILTFIAQEMGNNRFTIPELILLIASKRRVTHYPRITKKKNKGAFTSSNEGALMSLQWYISVVSIWGSCFKLLQVVLVFCLHLYLFWWGSCLRLTLVSISISTTSNIFN